MDDNKILEKGGDEHDIEEYAKQNGADLTKKDVDKECKYTSFWDCHHNKEYCRKHFRIN